MQLQSEDVKLKQWEGEQKPLLWVGRSGTAGGPAEHPFLIRKSQVLSMGSLHTGCIGLPHNMAASGRWTALTVADGFKDR